MSMHTKTDSEVTSQTASSPARSPRRPVYFVQSPSRDSHDGEKTTNSFHSTPVLSPTGSPSRHSRNSSSTRFSGSLRPGSRKGTQPLHNRKDGKGFDAIEEEGLVDDDQLSGIPRRCYFLAFVVGFFVLFSFFALVLWAAAKPQKPDITMRSISFDKFVVNAGADASGVATEMMTMNATIRFNFRNRGTFFGVHVSSTPLDLAYTANPSLWNYQEVLSIKKGAESSECEFTGRWCPVIRWWCELEQREGQTDRTGATERKLHG